MKGEDSNNKLKQQATGHFEAVSSNWQRALIICYWPEGNKLDLQDKEVKMKYKLHLQPYLYYVR
jgi:hypothetical protein